MPALADALGMAAGFTLSLAMIGGVREVLGSGSLLGFRLFGESFVVEQDGRVLGCGGMGPLAGGEADVCELRKMYFLPQLRGNGLGSALLTEILAAARRAGYRLCYLETLEHMDRARQLYGKFGFKAIAAPLGDTGHRVCNHWMILEL